MTRSLKLTALFLLVTTSACGASASLVRKDVAGGRVQLSGAFMPAVMEAQLLMAEHCDGRFQAVENGNTLDFRCGRGGDTEIAMHGARTGL